MFKITVQQLAAELHVAPEKLLAVAAELGLKLAPGGASHVGREEEVALRVELARPPRGGDCDCCGLASVPVTSHQLEDGTRYKCCVACTPHARMAMRSPTREILAVHRARFAVYEEVSEKLVDQGEERLVDVLVAQVHRLREDKAALAAKLAEAVRLPRQPEAVRLTKERDAALDVLGAIFADHLVQPAGKCACGLAAGRCPERMRLQPHHWPSATAAGALTVLCRGERSRRAP